MERVILRTPRSAVDLRLHVMYPMVEVKPLGRQALYVIGEVPCNYLLKSAGSGRRLYRILLKSGFTIVSAAVLRGEERQGLMSICMNEVCSSSG